MTIEQFKNQRWGANMKVIYEGETHNVVSVNFIESLIGLEIPNNDEDINWVRCENCELKSQSGQSNERE